MPSNKLNPADLFRIAVISDTHLLCGSDERATRHRQNLDRVIAAVDASHVDIALFLGDLTDRATPEDLGAALEQVEDLAGTVLYVPGNHDVGDKPSAGGPNPITRASLKVYEDAIDSPFFEGVFDGLRVIGVTASLFNSGLSRERKQWRFLNRVLQNPTPEPTILLTHYPLFVESPDEPPDQWNIDLIPRTRLLTLIQQGAVSAVLSGHTHHPRMHRREGALFATVPAVSFGLPRDSQPEGWALLTISSKNEANVTMYEI